MHSALFLVEVLCVVSVAHGRTTRAPLLAADSPTAVPNEYLVRLYPGDINEQQVAAHLSEVNRLLTASTGKVLHIWHIGAFHGYAVRMDDESLEKVRKMKAVEHVERNQVVKAFCNRQADAEWGLCRTTVRDWEPLEPVSVYSYDNEMAGEGVDVYVIDTGVYLEHHDFEGRASWGIDYVDTPSPETDLNGHGTHIAGTIAGKVYGIAKKACIIAIRVLNAEGSGTTAGVISGIDWVVRQHKSQYGTRSVANLSIGGSRSEVMNMAVEAAFNEGVVMVASAGGQGQSACNSSPASAKVITVAASDINDVLASSSNSGECVEVIAPGVLIKAPWIGSETATRTLSGTSTAAPHVSGVFAKYLSSRNAPSAPNYEAMYDYLNKTCTKDKIDLGPRQNFNNWLIFMDCVE